MHLLLASLLFGALGTTAHGQASGAVLQRKWIVGTDQGEQKVVFGSIQDVEYHPNRGLHVLDTGVQTVQRYDTNGHRIGDFEYREGQGPGELQQPMDLGVNADGEVFVADRGLRRVVQFTPEGEFVQQHSVPFAPTRVAPMQDRIFLAPFWLTSDSTLYVSAPDGSGRHGILPRPEQWKTTAMTGNFERLEVTPEGTLLRSLPYPYRLTEMDTTGTLLRKASGHPSFDAPKQSGGVTRMQEGVRGLALLETGRVVHLIIDRTKKRVYLDLFSRGLTFEERVDITDELPSMPSAILEAGPGKTLYFIVRDPYPQVVSYMLDR